MHDMKLRPADTVPGLSQSTSCRLCGANVTASLVDLGMSPLCESFLTAQELDAPERYYPLHALVCGECYLVQLKQYVAPEHIFREYAYFSSYSTSWVAHAKAYCEMVTARFGLGAGSLAVELASNDGYLLQHFSALSVPCLGIEPAANVADIAIRRQSNETSAVSRPASAVDCTVRAARYSAARSFTFAIASSTLGRSMENVVSEVTTA